jgi:hypothetical protein
MQVFGDIEKTKKEIKRRRNIVITIAAREGRWFLRVFTGHLDDLYFTNEGHGRNDLNWASPGDGWCNKKGSKEILEVRGCSWTPKIIDEQLVALCARLTDGRFVEGRIGDICFWVKAKFYMRRRE